MSAERPACCCGANGVSDHEYGQHSAGCVRQTHMSCYGALELCFFGLQGIFVNMYLLVRLIGCDVEF